VALNAVIIRLGIRPTVRRSGGLPIAAFFCVGMIVVGCIAATSISNTAVAIGVFLFCLIFPALALSSLSTSKLRAQRPAAIDELLTSIAAQRSSISAGEVCRRYAEFRQQFDLQFLGFEFAPTSAEPFVSDFRKLEAAAGCPLPRIWMLGRTSGWKKLLSVTQRNGIQRKSTYRALTNRMSLWWIIWGIVLNAISVIVAMAALILAQRAGLSSSLATTALPVAAFAVAFAAGRVLVRRAFRHRELRFVVANPPILEKAESNDTDKPSLVIDWDDLICFVQDCGEGRWPYSYANGRPNLRFISLTHGFVVDLLDLPPIPDPWMDAMHHTVAQDKTD